MSDEAIKGIQRFFGRVKRLFSPQTEGAARQSEPRYDVRAVPAFYEDRARTLQFIRESPLVYGYWGDFKRIFKEAETVGDRELLTALLARLDAAPFPFDQKPIVTPLAAAQVVNFDRMALQGNFAFLPKNHVSQNAFVAIVEISNPALPSLVHRMPFSSTKDVAVQGDRLFVLTGTEWSNDGQMLIYDISDIRHPIQLGKHYCPRATQVVAQGNLAFILCRPAPNETMQIVDVADPTNPQQIGAFHSKLPLDLVVDGEFAYLLTAQSLYNRPAGKLSILRMSDPTAPRILREIEIAAPTGLAVHEGHIMVTTGQANNGLLMFEAPPGNPEKVVNVPAPLVEAANAVSISGRYAYVAREKPYGREQDTGGIAVVDIVEKRIVSLLPGEEIQSLKMHNETLFAIESARYVQSLRAFDVSNPARLYLIGTPPSRETVAYMKRRARRVLREIAAQEPDSYAAFAAEVLAQSGDYRDAIDFDTDWLTVPILFGGGKRWQQTQHNRGRFVCRVPAFVRTRREESYPALWDKTPQVAEPLFSDASRPRETREFALRLLWHHALPIPALSEEALTRSLQSGSALLAAQATHQIAAMLKTGDIVLPETAAEAFFRGSKPARHSVLAALDKAANDRKYNAAFAARLYTLAAADNEVALTRKQQAAFGLLAARFAPTIRSAASPALTVRLYATGQADLVSLAEDVFAHLRANDLLDWLLALDGLTNTLPNMLPDTLPNTLEDAPRDRALALILPNIAPQLFRIETARKLVVSPQTWVREAGWILLANSATPAGVYEKLWNELLDFGDDAAALATAVASPAALSLLPRISFDYDRLVNALGARPQLLEGITPQIFERLLPGFALNGLLELIALLPDAQWTDLRAACISGLQKFERGLAFWGEVFAQVNALGDTAVSRRLLDDADLTETFVTLPDIGDLLKSANPAFGALLGRWVAAHSANFDRDSPELLAIATSRQPEIRAIGRVRLQTVGMSLPFALRLLESELPDAIEAGKAFFAQAEATQMLEYAVALCDSPQRSVRNYGLQYTEMHLPALDSAALFARLSENPNTEVQVWVAKKLRAGDAPNADVFDRAVLRQRDKGRKAKEAVKKQRTSEPAADRDLLLEMARSRTPRDAEWALQELAKLALTGAEIPGVTLEGAAGG